MYRVFCLWGWYFVWSLSPSSPDPCLVLFACVLLFFLSGLFVDAVSSLSVSQALGNPKPFWFGVPLVFLQPGRDLSLRPVPRGRHLHQGHLPHLFFFFSSSLVFVVVVVGRGLSCVFWAPLPLSLSLFPAPGVCMHVRDRELGWPIGRRPINNCDGFFGGVEHGTVSRTFRPEPLVLPPPPPAVP